MLLHQGALFAEFFETVGHGWEGVVLAPKAGNGPT